MAVFGLGNGGSVRAVVERTTARPEPWVLDYYRGALDTFARTHPCVEPFNTP